MNLELIDPFGRHVPDRIDSTYNLPKDRAVVPLCCSFNRRGTYLAVAYDDNTVAVFSCLSRSVVAMYSSCSSSCSSSATTTPARGMTSSALPPTSSSNNNNNTTTTTTDASLISWSRRSRRLLVGSPGEYRVRWIDTTHPLGPELASESLWQEATSLLPTTGLDGDQHEPTVPNNSNNNSHNNNNNNKPRVILPSTDHGVVLPTHTRIQTQASSFRDEEDWKRVNVKTSRQVKIAADTAEDLLDKTDATTTTTTTSTTTIQQEEDNKGKSKIYCTLEIVLPYPLKNSLQAFDDRIGFAVLENGSLVVLTMDPASFGQDGPGTYEVKTLVKSNVVCAAHDNKRLFVATLKNGLFVYSLHKTNGDECCRFDQTDRHGLEKQYAAQITDCTIRRNKLLFNGKDGILRLYDTNKIDEGPVVFQDLVTKTKFTTMGISGDGEYVVAAVNQFANTKYGVYIWDAMGGRLVDKLTGSGTSVQHVCWHPTRPIIAVACGDGMIDVWGTRINWTAFAPDFQALPENVEYIEREDEFDLDGDGNPLYMAQEKTKEDRHVNVTTIEPVPAFASDSEDEDSVFDFAPRVKNVIAVKGQKSRNSANQDD